MNDEAYAEAMKRHYERLAIDRFEEGYHGMYTSHGVPIPRDPGDGDDALLPRPPLRGVAYTFYWDDEMLELR